MGRSGEVLTFGTYGGRYVPETLIPALDELTAAWQTLRDDESFRTEVQELLENYGGRPTPLTRVERFAPGKRMYLKREDLLHTGAHKLNNALGQPVLARSTPKSKDACPRSCSRASAAARTRSGCSTTSSRTTACG